MASNYAKLAMRYVGRRTTAKSGCAWDGTHYATVEQRSRTRERTGAYPVHSGALHAALVRDGRDRRGLLPAQPGERPANGDAAALAGAQDLPGNASQAQTDALAYITKNGMSTANTTISFTCTSQNPSVCTSNSGTYDTIVVTQKAKSPTYFGGVLSVLGISNCWVTGCTSSATAAGCRGACGWQISTPLDVVIDH